MIKRKKKSILGVAKEAVLVFFGSIIFVSILFGSLVGVLVGSALLYSHFLSNDYAFIASILTSFGIAVTCFYMYTEFEWDK